MNAEPLLCEHFSAGLSSPSAEYNPGRHSPLETSLASLTTTTTTKHSESCSIDCSNIIDTSRGIDAIEAGRSPNPSIIDDTSKTVATWGPLDRRYLLQVSTCVILIKLLALSLVLSLILLMYLESDNDLIVLKDKISSLRRYRLSAPIVYWATDSLLLACGMSGETMNMLGGYLFGHLMGNSVYGSQASGTAVALVVCAASTFCGASITFFLGRSFLRHRAIELKSNPWWWALDNIIARYGVLLVTSLRFSPIVPFALLNLLLGASALQTHDFLISVLGSMPFLYILVNFGSDGTTGLREIWHHRPYRYLIIGGGLGTLILTGCLLTLLRYEAQKHRNDSLFPSDDAVLTPETSTSPLTERCSVLTSPLLQREHRTLTTEDMDNHRIEVNNTT